MIDFEIAVTTVTAGTLLTLINNNSIYFSNSFFSTRFEIGSSLISMHARDLHLLTFSSSFLFFLFGKRKNNRFGQQKSIQKCYKHKHTQK